MNPRIRSRREFIAHHNRQDWEQTPIAQDASSRSYIRMTRGQDAEILMDAPPNAGEQVKPFVDIANALCDMGLASPRILATDLKQGFLIIEDLGKTDFAAFLNQDTSAAASLYAAATDVLIHLHHQTPPPLPVVTPNRAGEMVRIVAEEYITSPYLADDLERLICDVFQRQCGPPQHIALRDFHAENLIWRPDQTGHQRVGLLDFQDAVTAPAGYDVASLTRDARRDIPAEVSSLVVQQFANGIGADLKEIETAIACLSVQRNLRILGVFARLIRKAGKPRYREMLPRVWHHVLTDLQHPVLSRLQDIVLKGIPNPTDVDFS